jgi:hypothetical protein
LGFGGTNTSSGSIVGFLSRLRARGFEENTCPAEIPAATSPVPVPEGRSIAGISRDSLVLFGVFRLFDPFVICGQSGGYVLKFLVVFDGGLRNSDGRAWFNGCK